MKLWISAELDANVADKHQLAWKPIQEAVNRRTKRHAFTSHWKSWDFISIIMSDPDFLQEVAKKSLKDKSLEFRLKIDHRKFLKASQPQAKALLLDALRRSVNMMSALEVANVDIAFLKRTLSAVAKDLER